MKKRAVAMMLALCLLASAVSCSKKTDDTGMDTSDTTATPDTTETITTTDADETDVPEDSTGGDTTDIIGGETEGETTSGEPETGSESDTVTAPAETTTDSDKKNEPDEEEKTVTVEFSKAAGFYDQAFKLVLSAPNGYTIYYTNNGDDPRSSGVKYTVPIEIKDTSSVSAGTLAITNNNLAGNALPSGKLPGGTVIKAYAKKNGEETPVSTNSYFVIKNASKLYDVPFVSISMKGSEFVSSDRGIYYTVMADPLGKKERRDSYVEIFEKDGKRVCCSYIELAMNGNGSLGLHSKSMRLYFKKSPQGDIGDGKLKYDIFLGQAQDDVTEFKRIILRNAGNDGTGAHLRDGYAQRLCSVLNAPTMAYRAAFLFVDGEFWGVYNIRERFDGKYFKEHFGIPEEDFVMIEAPSPLTTNWATNEPYILNDGEEGDEKPFNELVTYIKTHDMSNSEYYDYVCSQLDTDNLIDFFCGSIYLANNDWPSNNIKVYRSKNVTGTTPELTKWRFVFSDMDMTCSFVEDYNRDMFAHAINYNTVAGSIFSALLENNSFKKKFVKRMTECATTIFSPERALPILDEMTDEIDGVMQYHYKRWPGDGASLVTWNANLNAIRTFINNRGAVILKQLEEKYGSVQTKVMVSTDSSKATLSVNGKSVTDNSYELLCDDGDTVTLAASVKSGYTFKGYYVTDKSGNAKTYTTSTVKLAVNNDTTVKVVAVKNDFKTTPAVVAGSRSIFVLDADGELYAWGENDHSQNLIYTSSTVTKPVHVASGVAKIEISRGGTEGDAPQTVILTDIGDVYTVGCNNNGQLARNGKNYILDKVKLSFKAKDISAGFDHLLILSQNGELYGCGNNSYGQLGKTNYGSSTSTLVKLASNVSKIAAGRRHSLYITNDNKLYVLGDNRWNKISSKAPEVIDTPYLLASDAKEVYAGQHNSLYINTSNQLFYFGWRSTTTFNAGESNGAMNKIADNVKKASIMDEHIIFITQNGEVYGMGYNNYGQISTDKQNKSTAYKIMDGCIDASAGTYYSAALKSDGTVCVWGSNKSGVAGNGSVSDAYTSTTPLKIKVK